MHPLLGKALYGGLFVLVLPLALVLWAAASAPNVRLPSIQSIPLGVCAVGLGAMLAIAGMVSLRVYGGGLPMNPFPPPRYVARGAYRFVGDPIYLGFGVLCVGCAVTVGSSSGLWLVSPVVILATVALVLGYERIDLRQRFGTDLPQPLLRLPPDEGGRPTAADRISVYALVLLPWALLYEWLAALGVPPDAVSALLPLRARLAGPRLDGIPVRQHLRLGRPRPAGGGLEARPPGVRPPGDPRNPAHANPLRDAAARLAAPAVQRGRGPGRPSAPRASPRHACELVPLLPRGLDGPCDGGVRPADATRARRVVAPRGGRLGERRHHRDARNRRRRRRVGLRRRTDAAPGNLGGAQATHGTSRELLAGVAVGARPGHQPRHLRRHRSRPRCPRGRLAGRSAPPRIGASRGGLGSGRLRPLGPDRGGLPEPASTVRVLRRAPGRGSWGPSSQGCCSGPTPGCSSRPSASLHPGPRPSVGSGASSRAAATVGRPHPRSGSPTAIPARGSAASRGSKACPSTRRPSIRSCGTP